MLKHCVVIIVDPSTVYMYSHFFAPDHLESLGKIRYFRLISDHSGLSKHHVSGVGNIWMCDVHTSIFSRHS
jgi:hypothetical protein